MGSDRSITVGCPGCGAELLEGEDCPRCGKVERTFRGEALLEGKYRLIEPIGRGGMGMVYKARDESLDRLVAIKFLAPELQADKDFVERFRREARAMAMVRHANVVQIFSFGEVRSRSFFVMEFVEGRTAEEVLDDIVASGGRLALDVAKKLIEQSAAGLAAIHRAGVIHRDIKPANIMVDAQDGRALIMDFGIGRRASSGDSERGTKPLGTPAYMAPEIVTGRRPIRDRQHLSDIYAFGVTAFELLTGVVPFDGDSWVDVFIKHVNQAPPRPSDLRPEIPAVLDESILRCLAKNPEDRFDSATEMLEALRLASDESMPPKTISPPPTNSSISVGSRVIVADVDAANRYVFYPPVQEMLTNAQFQAARSNTKAFEIAQGAPPLLLIAALDDPGLNGIELAGLIRSHEELRGVRLVLTADRVTSVDRRMFSALGVWRVLLRPVGEADARDLISALADEVQRPFDTGSFKT